MPYREVDLATKCEVVKEYWRKKDVPQIVQDYDVSRRSVYDWVNIAESGISDALRSDKDTSKQINLVSKLEKEKNALMDDLREMCERYKTLSQSSQLKTSLKLEEHEIRPGQCLKCRSTEILKNGKYKVINKKRRDIIKGTDLIQRFICKKCGTRIYLSKKRAL